MKYWTNGNRVRFDDGVNNGSFTEEYEIMHLPYLAWLAEGNTPEEWNPEE